MYCDDYTFLGQHDDARMCIAIAITASRMGACVANHTEVVDLIKTEQGGKSILSGAVLKDKLTGWFSSFQTISF